MLGWVVVSAQQSGRLKGVVRTSAGAPVSGGVVIATNQVTRKVHRTRSDSDGSYSLSLSPGAYRLSLEQPNTALFDRDKNYGDFAIVRGDTLENVVIEAGKETVVDIPIAPLPTGPAPAPQRREMPDRWRLTFPEYDRYGDRGARGRDIPFKRGRWWDPYNQNVLKGDYPIKGDKLFLILSAVTSTNVEQRREPTPSDVSSVDPLSGEFFGRPEQFAASETLQFSFELFHGDTTFKPRDWAIKFSPTFSVPNYLNARENGVVNIDVRPHAIKVGYLGFSGDGHLGRLNLSHSYYFAFGHDERNQIAGRRVNVRSNMAAAELSVDKDYLRFKGSFFFAQGDGNPTDGRGSGFDAIFDDPNFVGGQFSFWVRNGIRLTQTGVGLVQPNSLLPSLRSSKTQGQANFVNPGIFIYNGGVDVELTQRIKAVVNVNYLRFHRTEPLELILFQNRFRHDIGFDYSLGVAYRPFLINNFTLTFGANSLQTGRGFRDIFTDASRNCPPGVEDFCQPNVISPKKMLYSLFGQAKFVF